MNEARRWGRRMWRLILAGGCAASVRAAADGGTAAGGVLTLLGSARAAGLVAGAAAGEGLAGMPENPAALGGQDAWALAGTWLRGVADTQVGQVSAAAPTPAGTVALVVGGMTTGRVDAAEVGGTAREVDAQRDVVTGAVFARPLGAGIAAGAGVKWYRSTLAETVTAGAVAFDIGVRWTSARGALALGAVVANAGSPLEYVAESSPLPGTVTLSAAWRALRVGSGSFLVAGEAVRGIGTAETFRAGAEADLGGLLAIRAGGARMGAVTTLSAGLGLRWGGIAFDYALTAPAGMPAASRAGLAVTP